MFQFFTGNTVYGSSNGAGLGSCPGPVAFDTSNRASPDVTPWRSADSAESADTVVDFDVPVPAALSPAGQPAERDESPAAGPRGALPARTEDWEKELVGLVAHLRGERQSLTEREKALLLREQAFRRLEEETRQHHAQEEDRLQQLSQRLRQWEQEFQEKILSAEAALVEEENRLSRMAADLAAQREQLDGERAEVAKQRQELRNREIAVHGMRNDAEEEIRQLKEQAAQERQKSIEAHEKLTEELMRLVRLRENMHEMVQALRGAA